MKNTKSDWFMLESSDGTTYQLEVFGVNPDKGTKHCMRLLFRGIEFEVFHLDSINYIIKTYDIVRVNGFKQTQDTTLKQFIISNSTQLQNEGIGVINSGTQLLIEMMKRRQQNE